MLIVAAVLALGILTKLELVEFSFSISVIDSDLPRTTSAFPSCPISRIKTQTPVAQLPLFSGHSVFWSASPRAAFANSERSNRAINSGGAEPTASLYAGHIR